jgi:homoserine kinase type II
VNLEQAWAALNSWDLGRVEDVQQVLQGSVNRVFRVQSEAGLFYLRLYRVTDVAVLEREALVMAAARAGGVPVPEAVPPRRGEVWIDLNSQLCILFREAVGEQVVRTNLASAHAAAAGVALAHLHRTLERLPDLGWRRYRVQYDRSEWLARLDAIGVAIQKVPAPDETDAWALQRLQGQARWMTDARCLHTADLSGPRQVIHGDFHDANLFFAERGEQVTGVIDWEQAAWMPRTFEAMRSAHYMFGTRPILAATFLRAYATSLGINAAEMNAAAQTYGVQADHWVWALEEVYLHGNARARAFIVHAPFEPFQLFWREVQNRPELHL